MMDNKRLAVIRLNGVFPSGNGDYLAIENLNVIRNGFSFYKNHREYKTFDRMVNPLETQDYQNVCSRKEFLEDYKEYKKCLTNDEYFNYYPVFGLNYYDVCKSIDENQDEFYFLFLNIFVKVKIDISGLLDSGCSGRISKSMLDDYVVLFKRNKKL